MANSDLELSVGELLEIGTYTNEELNQFSVAQLNSILKFYDLLPKNKDGSNSKSSRSRMRKPQIIQIISEKITEEMINQRKNQRPEVNETLYLSCIQENAEETEAEGSVLSGSDQNNILPTPHMTQQKTVNFSENLSQQSNIDSVQNQAGLSSKFDSITSRNTRLNRGNVQQNNLNTNAPAVSNFNQIQLQQLQQQQQEFQEKMLQLLQSQTYMKVNDASQASLNFNQNNVQQQAQPSGYMTNFPQNFQGSGQQQPSTRNYLQTGFNQAQGHADSNQNFIGVSPNVSHAQNQHTATPSIQDRLFDSELAQVSTTSNLQIDR